MWLRLVLLVACWLLVLPASADDVMSVSCRGTRVTCEEDLLAACPSGAVIVEERLVPMEDASGEILTQYTLLYRCGGEASAPAVSGMTTPDAHSAPLPASPGLEPPAAPSPSPSSPSAAPAEVQTGPRLAPGARAMTTFERTQLRLSQLEILRTERSRVRLGPPIALLSVGIALIHAQIAMGIAYGDARAALMWPLMVPSVVANVVGVLWLTKAVQKRRGFTREIERLSRVPVSWSVAATHAGGSASLSLRF